MGTILVDEELETRTVQQDLADALALIERANAKLRPDELSRSEAHSLIDAFGRIVKLGGFGVASLSPILGDAAAVARVSGTSMGKAREAVATGTAIQTSPDLNAAMRQGSVSLDQAAEIARAEEAAPGSARSLVKLAQGEAFHVLKDKARKVKLEAEQHRDLATRQHEAPQSTEPYRRPRDGAHPSRARAACGRADRGPGRCRSTAPRTRGQRRG